MALIPFPFPGIRFYFFSVEGPPLFLIFLNFYFVSFTIRRPPLAVADSTDWTKVAAPRARIKFRRVFFL